MSFPNVGVQVEEIYGIRVEGFGRPTTAELPDCLGYAFPSQSNGRMALHVAIDIDQGAPDSRNIKPMGWIGKIRRKTEQAMEFLSNRKWRRGHVKLWHTLEPEELFHWDIGVAEAA